MTWLIVYAYLSGAFLAGHVAFETDTTAAAKKLAFVVLWPALAAPLYAWAIWKAVRK